MLVVIIVVCFLLFGSVLGMWVVCYCFLVLFVVFYFWLVWLGEVKLKIVESYLDYFK